MWCEPWGNANGTLMLAHLALATETLLHRMYEV